MAEENVENKIKKKKNIVKTLENNDKLSDNDTELANKNITKSSVTETKKLKKEKFQKADDKTKDKKENPMRKIKIEKVVLSVGGVGEELEKGFKLLSILTNKKPVKTKSKKRIPTLGIRPGLEIGAVVNIRKNIDEVLKKMLVGVGNELKRKQISENNFSFGIKEYLQVPGIEYQRDIGMVGFNVTVVFGRGGGRVRIKKIKKGKIPKKQAISKEEIIKFMEERFGTQFV